MAAIYLIWGSTYLGVRYAIETLPPLVMAGTRVMLAGLILYGWTRLRGATRPSPIHWRDAAVVGGLLLLGGNGTVAWGEQYVPSGLAALICATVPLWIVLFDWIRPGGERPPKPVALGVGLGLLGMVLLVGPAHLLGGTALHLVGVTVILLGTLAWSIGSLYSRRASLTPVPLQTTAMQLVAGGAWLFLAAALTGDWGRLDLAAISVRSLLALSYLVVIGSTVGFTVYLWLMRTTSPALASTYAYVNPVVAMLLGWALAAESFTWQTLVAAAIIISGVALITLGRWRH